MKRVFLLKIAVTCIAVATVCVLLTVAFIKPNRSSAQVSDDVGSLAWLANQANAQGETTLNRLVSVLHPSVNGFDEAKNRYSIIAVQLVSSSSHQLGTDEIISWHKFRVLENLSSKPYCSACPTIPNPPSTLFPLNPDEILVPSGDGSLVINGVTINDYEYRLPTYTVSEKYVLFLNFDASSKVGDTAIGPVGALAIDANGNLSPVHEGSIIWSDLSSRGITTLGQLRIATGGPAPTTTPTPCHVPAAIRLACARSGGVWNPSVCECE